MTIGELYIRQGETFQAIDYFERLRKFLSAMDSSPSHCRLQAHRQTRSRRNSSA